MESPEGDGASFLVLLMEGDRSLYLLLIAASCLSLFVTPLKLKRSCAVIFIATSVGYMT